MKVYIDCLRLPMPCRDSGLAKTISELHGLKEKWRQAYHVYDVFKGQFENQGMEVLSFITPHLSFDPYRGEIADFVREADAVVALSLYPFAGFSSQGKVASQRFKKPRFLFVPHSADVVFIQNPLSPTLVRCLYCTPDFPGRVVSKFCLGEGQQKTAT